MKRPQSKVLRAKGASQSCVFVALQRMLERWKLPGIVGIASEVRDRLSYICHEFVMKNAVLCSLAFALVSPAALADSAKSQPTPYAISVKSDLTPIAHSDFRYPYIAARQGLDGTCDVAFAIDPQGRPQSVSIVSCSSEAFQGAAKTIVQGMTFRATGAHVQSVAATIRWDINPRQYASLN